MESNVVLCLINKVSEKVDIICTEQQEKLIKLINPFQIKKNFKHEYQCSIMLD